MRLWVVIMFLGAAGCGWLFLEARKFEAVNIKKKVKQGSKTVMEKARKASGFTGAPPVKPHEILRAEQQVNMSKDVSTRVVEQIEEIMRNEEKVEGAG